MALTSRKSWRRAMGFKDFFRKIFGGKGRKAGGGTAADSRPRELTGDSADTAPEQGWTVVADERIQALTALVRQGAGQVEDPQALRTTLQAMEDCLAEAENRPAARLDFPALETAQEKDLPEEMPVDAAEAPVTETAAAEVETVTEEAASAEEAVLEDKAAPEVEPEAIDVPEAETAHIDAAPEDLIPEEALSEEETASAEKAALAEETAPAEEAMPIDETATVQEEDQSQEAEKEPAPAEAPEDQPAAEEPAPPAPPDYSVLAGKKLLAGGPLAQVLPGLQEQDLAVTEAANGLKTVELFSASEPGTYDCVVLAVKMPMMNGETAAKCIRSLKHPDGPGVPLFLVEEDGSARTCGGEIQPDETAENSLLSQLAAAFNGEQTTVN
jgi:CheY-like chemotaxis protein